MSQLDTNESWLASAKPGNVMQELIRSRDWSQTPLGKPENWPRSLKVALDIILHSGYPMFIWWGRDLIMFHNDAYLPVLGQKHPDALGRSAREVWSEIWPEIGSIVDNVFRGEEFHAQDLLLYLGRKGFMEETYWTFSYSPFLDDKGAIGGLFCACNEESEKILGQRRLNCIKNISALSAKYKDLPSLNRAIPEVLGNNPKDIPFSALYLREGERATYELKGHSGGGGREHTFPAAFSSEVGTNTEWEVIREIQKNKQLVITRELWQNLITGQTKESEKVETLALIPLLKPGQQEVTGLLLCGLSPYLEFEETYKNYLTLTAAQISTAIADVRLLEEERRRGEALKESEKKFRELTDNVPIIIRVTDSEGSCTYLNQQWYDYSGQDHFMGSGLGWLEKVHPDDAPAAKEIFLKANEEQTPFSLYYRLRNRTGNYFWHVDTSMPRFDQVGRFQGFTGVVFDVHEAKMAEEQKNDFLRIAGHELRTPLTSIVGYLGLLQRMSNEQDPGKVFLDKCLQNTLKMRSLISDFLDISKVERGELSFTMQNIDFSDLLKETIENLNFADSRHVLDMQIESGLYIYGDKGRLEQLILNLINNAQKYSQDGQTIKISLTTKSGKVLFRIQDEGIGMEQQEVEKIFRKFYRIPSKSKTKGIGLGLYIAKKIIDYHHGDIQVQTVPGKGTQFTVELPLIKEGVKKNQVT